MEERSDLSTSQVSMASLDLESTVHGDQSSTSEPLISAIDTFEALPSTQFYRSLAAKRVGAMTLRSGERGGEESDQKAGPAAQGGQFGAFSGVYLRCILNIISVVFYLRLSWVVGNCGLGLTLVLILICGCCTSLTALSLSALATNGTVKGGGIYYFISRSLGADWGGTIGTVFSFATTFGTVLHVYGFVEVVRELINKPVPTNGEFDIWTPILGISLATVLLTIICIALSFEFILQYILGFLIVASVFATLLGFLAPGDHPWEVSNIKANWAPDFQKGESFFTIFGVFFPACTGIMAGANISGDLKDPQKAIPIGTLGAIGTTTLCYMVFAVIIAAGSNNRTELHEDSTVLGNMCLWKPLIIIGCIAASISSASAAMVGGPKIFQAFCKDDILPPIFKFFAVGKKSSGDPIRGFILAYVIVFVSCFIFKDLNAVGNCITQFNLLTYSIVCLSCLVGKMSKSPSWRPAWKYYHPVTAILGAAACVAGMFLTNYVFALVVVLITVCIFMYFHWSERVTVSWGEFPQALLYTNTVSNLTKLNDAAKHVKTYRPQIEFIINHDVGSPEMQIKNLVPFTQIEEQAYGLLVVSHVGKQIPSWPLDGLDKVFTRTWGDVDLSLCARLIAQAGGFGKVAPNIIAMPFISAMRSATNIFELIGGAFDNSLGVAISRGFEGFDPNMEYRWPIDVWWLSDDGGLIILLAYLLIQHKTWKRCKLRVFTVTTKEAQINQANMRMTKLLQMFRIPAEVIVRTGLDEKPSEMSMQHWREMNIPVEDEAVNKKVMTFLRLRELLLENSGQSSVVLCTLPIPRATEDPATWLGIIDVISDAMPPFLWVHGNNENVVTFMT